MKRTEWYKHKDRYWFVAIAEPNSEFKAEANLREQGFLTIFPTKPDYWFLTPQERRARRTRRRHNRNGGRVAIFGPLVFVGVSTDGAQSVRAVKETRGVFGMMESDSGAVVRVPAPVIETLEHWINGDALKEQPLGLQAPKKGERYYLNALAQQMENVEFEVARDAKGKDVGEFVKGFIRFMGGRVEASIPAEYLGERAELPRKAAGREFSRFKQRAQPA